MEFINLTPHDITVVGLGTLASRGIARVATTRENITPVSGVRLIRQAFGAVTGLPQSAPDTVYIVSAVVLGALNGTRSDVVAPDTGPDAIRESGQVKAVLGFVQ